MQTSKDYGNFELYVDWKIGPKGDSGLYLRGNPQVQIWDSDSLTGGLAADKGKGKIKVETKNETKTDEGDKAKTESRSEVKGDLKGLPFLGVKTLRMIASVCP